jgi:Family of unknown function (DUF6519)
MMSGDYSRFPFDSRRNYSGVLLQQGRILLDQDWNEQSAIARRGFRAALMDLLGRVFLATPDAFKIECDGRGGLSIGRGRIYVDGLMAENHGAGRPVWDAALDEQYGAEPLSYTQQPYLPAAPELPRSGGPYLVYLDVWQREVTTVEDPDLADPALEGADTTTRLQTVWQLKVREASSASAKRPLAEDCKFRPAASRLSTAPGGYTGRENQLYRVEVHDKGWAGAATFKWSRDNASTVARVTRLTDLSHVVVQAIGSQAVSGFSVGELIEITDDARELAGLPGELRRIKAIEAASTAFTLDTPLSQGLVQADQNGVPDATRHMRVRRWHGNGAIQSPGNWIELENGIAVCFDADPTDGCFRTGDYWFIPARVANQSFEPLDRAPPRGIHHHVAKLALFTPPSGLRDLRVQKDDDDDDE